MKPMHKFYFTNNLGGGGTNVSRLYDYIDLFDLNNIGILLNYYYLTGHSKPAFDIPLIAKLRNFNDLQSFVSYSKNYFSKKRSTSDSYFPQAANGTINGSILDNGCGNFLRNHLGSDDSVSNILSYVKPFLDFAESLEFFFYKANEVKNPKFMSKWKNLASDNKMNLSLLSKSLDVIKSTNYTHKILAPLHGYDYDSFSNYLENIKIIERSQNAKFGGFALGGIANTRVLDNDLWNVPDKFAKNLKSAYICYNLIKTIRRKTTRHIHVLGAGNIYTLPFLIHAGANSSDCHSAWRRASDGGINKAKILIPLLDKDFNFINTGECLEYLKVGDSNLKKYTFNCGYSIDKIQTLLNSSNKEDFYFGEILIFYEAILQYNILIEFIKQHPNNYLDLLSTTPDEKFNNNYLTIRQALNI